MAAVVPGPAGAGQQHGRLRRGPLPVRASTATCAPAPAPRPTWPRAASSRPAPSPGCARPTTWAPVDEGAPLDPRNVYAATKLHQEHLCSLWGREAGATVVALRYHNVYGPRMPRDTPYAGRGVHLPQRPGRRPGPRGVRGRGPDPRLRPRPGRGPGQRGRPHPARRRTRRLQHRQRRPPHRRRPGPGPGRRAAQRRRQPTWRRSSPARWRLGDVRHVVASPARAERALGFVAEVDFAAGMAEFAHAPQRARG